MPLRFIRSKVTPNNALQLAITTTSIAQQLTNMLQFPPASAAVSTLLLIFETIQAVQNNTEGCLRLARRAARILLDINDQMEGRWDSAPPLLIKNLRKFQDTLSEIYLFMRAEAESRWQSRFLRKSTIDGALMEFNARLDDATRSFQIATLINIHYAVSSQHAAASVKEVDENHADAKETRKDSGESSPSPILPPYSENPISGTSLMSESPSEIAVQAVDVPPEVVSVSGVSDVSPPDDLAGDPLLSGLLSTSSIDDDHGFRRYHQSDVRLRGRSGRLEGGWWEGATEVQVEGQKALMKRYEGSREQALKHWLRDVKVLSNIFHENLPQMMGYSDDRSPTPFILLTNVQTKSPQALVLETLRAGTLAESAELILRFYRDISDAAFYTQHQLGLSDSQLQDFVQDARFRIDDEKTVVMGLPPPKEGNWITARSYGLTHSLTEVCMTMLPNRGRTVEKRDTKDNVLTLVDRGRINHLVTLARGILPSENDPPTLSSRAQLLLDNGSDSGHSSPLTLHDIRCSNLSAKSHEHTWSARPIEAHKFSVGDLGYIPPGKGVESFVTLRNILKDGLASFSVTQNAFGDHWCWKSVPVQWQKIESYDLPGDVKGWPLAVPPQTQIDCQIVHEASVASVADAWRYLLDNGKRLANDFLIKPQDLILVTRVGTDQDFYIHHFGGPLMGGMSHHGLSQRPGFSQPQPFGFQRPGFPSHSHHHSGFPGQVPLPTIFYLFTSLDPAHIPYFSQQPMCVPKGTARPRLHHEYTYKIGWVHGFMNYIQLHAEDFDET